MVLFGPAVSRAAVHMGTINIEIDEEYYVDLGFTYSTVTGYWSKSNSTFTFVSQGSKTCKIRGNQEGYGTLRWWGYVNGDQMEYYWDVEVTKPEDLVASINSTNFPDQNFRNYLLSQSYGADGKLTQNEISSITKIDVRDRSIHNLKGIEFFTSLNTLICYDNQQTSLDVSKNTALTDLRCDNNQLISLNLSKNTALTILSCSENQLTFLDVSKNTALKELSCNNNQLTSLDVSKNTALTKLYCHENQLTFLDMSKNTALTHLYCSNNALNTLDVSKSTALTDLNCSNNQLTSLNMSKNTALKNLSCRENQLTSLDISKNTALYYLECTNNQLCSLDVSKNTALTTYLGCGYNQLSSLDISKNTALTYLFCAKNQLTTLDVSKNVALTDIFCYYNQLTHLDVSNNIDLKRLSIHQNKIKGAAMDALIRSLHPNINNNTHYFNVIMNTTGNEGNICTKTQVAAVKAKGWAPQYNTEHGWAEYEGSEDVQVDTGDLNSDGQVNGTDLVALVEVVLGRQTKTEAADVNGDGQVNGTDIVALSNIILGKTN